MNSSARISGASVTQVEIQLYIGSALALLPLLGPSLASYSSIRQTSANSALVTHMYEVIGALLLVEDNPAAATSSV
jgi:hypothetical protein